MNIKYISKVIRSCNYNDQVDTVREWVDRLPNHNISDYYAIKRECDEMEIYLKRRWEANMDTSDSPRDSVRYRLHYNKGLFKNATN